MLLSIMKITPQGILKSIEILTQKDTILIACDLFKEQLLRNYHINQFNSNLFLRLLHCNHFHLIIDSSRSSSSSSNTLKLGQICRMIEDHSRLFRCQEEVQRKLLLRGLFRGIQLIRKTQANLLPKHRSI